MLVHGEPERNDMVQYFGEQLAGVAVTELGWVQSYGTRYVRPPIIFGDVARPAPMTVEWLDLRPVAHPAAGQGHADRTGDHAEVVVRARRPAAGGDRAPARPGHPGRDGRPGGGRDRRHPGRRAGPARGPAAAPRPPPGLPGLGGGGVPAGHRRGPRRDPGPHPHVLLGVRRDPARDRRAGRRRDLDRGRPLAHGAGPRPGAGRLRARDRPRGLRHPLAPGAAARRDGHAAGRRPWTRSARPGCGSTPTAASRPATTRRCWPPCATWSPRPGPSGRGWASRRSPSAS